MRHALGSGGCAVALALVCVACGGSGEGLDESGRPIGSGSSPSTTLTADFNSIQANVFTPICTTCHAGASAPRGLRLDAANSYNLLVGIASVEVPTVQRVEPGDPQSSYLIQKLEGRAAVGAQMPLGGPPLPAATIAVIRQWITQGAPKSATQATTDRASIQSVNMETETFDASLIETGAQRLIVAFNRDIDVSLLNASNVSVRKAGEANSIPLFVVLNASNRSTAILTPTQPFSPGDYQLTLQSSSAGGIADLNGQLIGRDLQLEFTVGETR